MNSIYEASILTRDLLMFLPLIIFCFIPIIKHIKTSIGVLLVKIFLAILFVESIIFLFYLFLPFPNQITTLINSIVCVLIFFWLYQQAVAMARSHLFFIFMTACLIGGLSYLIFPVADLYLSTQGMITNPHVSITGALSTEAFFLQILFECLFILLSYYPTKKYLGWLVCNFHEEKVWRLIWLFPMIFTVVFYVIIPYDNTNSDMFIGRALDLYLMATIAFIIIVIVIYIMFYQIAFNIVKKQELAQRTHFLEMETEQYRKLQEYVENTRRLRHDVRYQLTALSAMIEQKEYQKAEDYLKQFSLNVSKPTKQFCESPAVNAVLNYYASFCQEENITTSFSFRIENERSIEDVDFCVLLGNLLENALYACRNVKEEQKHMELKVGQTSPHVIVLSMRNSFDGVVKKEGDVYLSTKHSGGGQGLKSISLIVEKYNGFIKIEHQDKEFHVKVLLNI